MAGPPDHARIEVTAEDARHLIAALLDLVPRRSRNRARSLLVVVLKFMHEGIDAAYEHGVRDGRAALANEIECAHQEAVDRARRIEQERLLREEQPSTNSPTIEDELHAIARLMFDDEQHRSIH